MSNHTVMIRPDPDTLCPTSRPCIQNSNNCSHCKSGIDKLDKTCTHCGAPNENYKQDEISKTYSDRACGWVKSSEKSFEPEENKFLEKIKGLENLKCCRIEQNLDVKDIDQELNILNKLYKETEIRTDVRGGINNQLLYTYIHTQ